MKLWEVVRFEIVYQTRRPSTWMFVVALFAICFQITMEGYTGNARVGGYAFNSPFVIAAITILGSVMSLIVVGAFAGESAARDVQTRMHPLVYTSSVREGTHLLGRFLGAFALSAILLLGVQAALMLAAFMPSVPSDLLAPFRPRSYLTAYLAIALPNAFVAAALLFVTSVRSRRSIAGYVAAVVLFFATVVAWQLVAVKFGRWDLARMMDPVGITVLSEISQTTTAAQKNVLSVGLHPSWLLSRAVWIGIALTALMLTYRRFRFALPAATSGTSRAEAEAPAPIRSITVPRVRRTFDARTTTAQIIVIAMQSLREVASSWGGLVLVATTTILVAFGSRAMNHLGVPLLPTTRQMTAFVGNTGELLWMIVPLLTVHYVGELVWRDRDTGFSDIADAAPVSDGARFGGKFLGLGLALLAYQVLLLAACILIQLQLGYHDFELWLYARALFGIMLADHVLFAAMAFAVHVLVNQKYVGHLLVIVVYLGSMSASSFGIEHNLLVYGASPAWSYSDLRGFGPSMTAWFWFKLYWGAWALLLALATRLYWVRGRVSGMTARFALARQRLRHAVVASLLGTVAAVLGIGGFVFYNTNVLNAYETSSNRAAHRAEYEQRYGLFSGRPQPRLMGTTLQVEIYAERAAAEIRGTYRLVNASGVAIDTIHIALSPDATTGPATFDRDAVLALDDMRLGHRVYVLRDPLLPGDSLRMDFRLLLQHRGFTNEGGDGTITDNAAFIAGDLLPRIGYQRERELRGAARAEFRLPPHPLVRSLDDVAARNDVSDAELVSFDAVVGTSGDEVVVAPGSLRRRWTENGRHYFHYVTDAPIRNDFTIAAARYAVAESRWNDVAIQVYHAPRHTWNVDRITRSVRASLDYLSRELGPYPYRQLRLVEHASRGNSLHASPINITYEEGFAIFNPDADPRGFDFAFAVVAHEVAHQWWGNQLTPANVEGSPLLTESLAWYSAMSVVQATYGDDHLRRLLDMMREAYLSPRTRAGVPLLRMRDRFAAYRTGPFAMYALREYVGAETVSAALRRLLEHNSAGTPPLPTSRDLLRELRLVTPDSLQGLLTDLFEANTFWELSTKRVTATETAAGDWQVTLDVKARKVVVDTAGVERELPMNDIVEIGVFGDSTPLALGMRRVRSGEQSITMNVPKRPLRAGVDPRHLLIDVKPRDNVAEVQRKR